MEKTVIFLGAGASASDNSPTQAKLFQSYLKGIGSGELEVQYYQEIKKFFEIVFPDCDLDNPENTSFPTFEEILGMVDIAVNNKEAFMGTIVTNGSLNNIDQINLYTVAKALTFLIAKSIENDLHNEIGKNHSKLVKKLTHNEKYLKNISFISTNYDLLIDNSLMDLYNGEEGLMIDYGIEFREENDWKKPTQEQSINLFKLHGSLNWLYCPTCKEIVITPKQKSVVHALLNMNTCKNNNCHSNFQDIIVPPTFFKDMRNIYLSIIWQKAEHVLRESQHVIFCGYSFPDADIHIKYLLKRAQVYQRSMTRYTVINHHEDKEENDKHSEKARFTRFLGNNVDYKDQSFEDFVDEPIAFFHE